MQSENDILQELENIGSKLGSYPRRMPYVVPDNYFENFPIQMLTTVRLENNVKQASETNAFEVPENYFEALPTRIIASIKKQEKAPSRVISFPGSIRRNIRFAAAAIFLLLVGGGLFWRFQQPLSLEAKLAALPKDVMTEYVVQSSEELQTNTNAIVSGNNHFTAQLTEEEITAYLNETGWQ